jgi:hypothetical protein
VRLQFGAPVVVGCSCCLHTAKLAAATFSADNVLQRTQLSHKQGSALETDRYQHPGRQRRLDLPDTDIHGATSATITAPSALVETVTIRGNVIGDLFDAKV